MNTKRRPVNVVEKLKTALRIYDTANELRDEHCACYERDCSYCGAFDRAIVDVISAAKESVSDAALASR